MLRGGPCSGRSHQAQLLCASQELLEGNPGFVQPAARRNEVLGWVRAGLRDFSISRAAVAWGIPIPRDPGQTVYVWFDALFGYASGARRRQQPQLSFSA